MGPQDGFVSICLPIKGDMWSSFISVSLSLLRDISIKAQEKFSLFSLLKKRQKSWGFGRTEVALLVGVQSVTQAAKPASTLTIIEAEPTFCGVCCDYMMIWQEHSEVKACSEEALVSISTNRKVSGVAEILSLFRKNNPLYGIGLVCFSLFLFFLYCFFCFD